MKKTLKITLISLFLLSVYSISFAANMTLDMKYNQAAKYLAEKTFIKDVSDYRTGDFITRKEALKLVTNVAYLKVENKCEGKFKDVKDDWGCKYIESALKAGFIKQNELFRPDDNITNSEFIKLLFRARNIEKLYNLGNWQEDYIKTAYDKGFIYELPTNYSENAIRGWIFIATSNTFDDFRNKYTIINDTNIYTDEIKVK